VLHLPPAPAASATPAVLDLLGAPPGRILELGFAGIHTRSLELAGWEGVVERDPDHCAHVILVAADGTAAVADT
jgi:hypothetical protein